MLAQEYAWFLRKLRTRCGILNDGAAGRAGDVAGGRGGTARSRRRAKSKSRAAFMSEFYGDEAEDEGEEGCDHSTSNPEYTHGIYIMCAHTYTSLPRRCDHSASTSEYTHGISTRNIDTEYTSCVHIHIHLYLGIHAHHHVCTHINAHANTHAHMHVAHVHQVVRPPRLPWTTSSWRR